MPKVEIYELMNERISLEQLSATFAEGFDDESHLVDAIKLHLLSQYDSRIIRQQNSSIEDMLNGRVPGDSKWIQQMYERWNSLLGFRCFGN